MKITLTYEPVAGKGTLSLQAEYSADDQVWDITLADTAKGKAVGSWDSAELGSVLALSVGENLLPERVSDEVMDELYEIANPLFRGFSDNFRIIPKR